jgi:serine/threonine protein kinase
MSSSVQPAPHSDQFETMAGLVVINGWATRSQLDNARTAMVKAHKPEFLADKRAMGRFLVESRILTSEQMTDLDGILQQQAHFQAYHLLKKLGAGGMGTVFLAKQIATGRMLALKTIIARLKEDADFVGRFHRECQVLAGLRHPHIAEVIESGDSNGICYMAMEHISGPSLATLLKDHKVLPEIYVLNIGKQVAEGLAYVYERAELVHRDIKPENILIARASDGSEPFPADDQAKLIDFGLVKPVADDEHLTQTGMTIGTPLYMSPEQIRGERIDCRSDIYGLGATLFHLLTGTTPFGGTSPGAIMSAHLTQPVPDPSQHVPGLSPKTRELVMMSMAKKREDRFLTFEGFIKAVAAALEDLGERQSSAPRLLRKPLVLKPIKKPAAAEKMAETSLPTAAVGVPATSKQSTIETTQRIAKKFRDANAEPSEEVGNRPVTTAVLRDPPPGPAKTAKPAVVPAEPASAPLKSAVFDEDPERQLGTGIVPWIVLGAAIAALIVWYFW